MLRKGDRDTEGGLRFLGTQRAQPADLAADQRVTLTQQQLRPVAVVIRLAGGPQQRVDHQPTGKMMRRVVIQGHHQRGRLGQAAQVVLVGFGGIHHHRGGRKATNFPKRLLQVLLRTDGGLGFHELVATALQRQDHRARVQPGKEIGRAAAALQGGRENMAPRNLLVTLLGIGIDSE